MEQKARELIVFLAGELQDRKRISDFIAQADADFYAADGGYKYATDFNVPLKRVFGDFDSSKIPKTPNLTIYPCEKDQTDSELALDLAIADGYTSVWMIAPFGGRLDHTVANLALLEKAMNEHIDLKLYDGKNVAFLLSEGKHTLRNDFEYVSFFPIHSTATVSLNDLKYPLKEKILQRMEPLAISNEPIPDKNPEITVHQGTVLCICIEKETI